MQSNFTETFVEYVNHELERIGKAGGNVSLVMPNELNDMPADARGTSFVDRFWTRNCYKEIGSETEELFRIHLNIAAQEVNEMYAQKILNFHSILQEDFRGAPVTLKRTEQLVTEGGQSNQYLNPINANEKKVLAGTADYTKANNWTESREHYNYTLTDAERYEHVAELDNMFEAALRYLDKLFMMVY